MKKANFHNLTPDTVIDLVEKGLKLTCSNLCRPLNSYINRVYELEVSDGSGIVVKFYRPGRWSKTALMDEHNFLMEMAEAEIPVIAPLKFKNGATLDEYGDGYFAVFEKKGGRSYDEYNPEQWLELGRLLGRAHSIGAGKSPAERLTLTPDNYTLQQVEYLLAGDFIPLDLAGQYKDICESLVGEISPFFKNIEMIRIHGDCHFANLIYRPDESFFLIDLDDMVVGPPVHDLWMLLPGFVEDSLPEIDFFLQGYETFRDFDRQTLSLIEPLRAMRYIHFTAWCARQMEDAGFISVTPDFGAWSYWQGEIRDLIEQVDRIKSSTSPLTV